MVRVRVWDLPTRLFHGLLALCVLCLAITGQIGGQALWWHFRFGYAVLCLLVFRLLWGFVGGHWSRWAQLQCSPKAVWAHASGKPSIGGHLGHNPLGSWSVLAMLTWLSVQACTGLISDDEIFNAGPLTSAVSAGMVAAATAWHKGAGKWVLLALVALHILAISYHSLYKRDHLIGPMLHGNRQESPHALASADSSQTRLWALACAALSCWIVSVAIAWLSP